jgi:tRNA pseudouridine synthase 9
MSGQPEAGDMLTQGLTAQNYQHEPASEPDPPIQLTVSEALSKISSMSASPPHPDVPNVAITLTDTTEPNPTTMTNGMTYCPECYLPLHPDPKPERLYIFLHALRYTTSMGCFETDMPEWAAEGWEWDRS